MQCTPVPRSRVQTCRRHLPPPRHTSWTWPVSPASHPTVQALSDALPKLRRLYGDVDASFVFATALRFWERHRSDLLSLLHGQVTPRHLCAVLIGMAAKLELTHPKVSLMWKEVAGASSIPCLRSLEVVLINVWGNADGLHADYVRY